MKEYTIEPLKLVEMLRKHFGDKNIILTVLLSNSNPNTRKKFKDIHASFGPDNFSEFIPWFALMRAKMVGGKYDAISIVLRHFLREQMIPFLTKDDRVIKIPKKEIYHFFILTSITESPELKTDKSEIAFREVNMKDRVFAFGEKESYEAQNTDRRTGRPLEPEVGVTCKSSIELLENLLKEEKSV